MAGPLDGVRIVEFAGIGPGPFAAMLLADQGAEVIRIDRPGARLDPRDPLLRSRRSVVLDMKNPAAVAAARAIVATADAVIEGYRPGVMERLGLGPERLCADHPRLVYGRITGWGQDGPWAQAAGHDINYVALAGVLHGIGRAGERPVPPVNYIGDFGGGGMLLGFGILAALLHAARTGQGQVVDAAMTDGSALLSAMTWGFRAMGMWRDAAGVNLLDGGAHFYDTYACADGKWLAVGAIEPQFYALLRDRLGIADDAAFDAQMDPAQWPVLRERLTAIFATRSRDAWMALFDGTDACVAPVLSLDEAPRHPHNAARGTFVSVGEGIQPAPAPRFGATPAGHPAPPPAPGADTVTVLRAAGLSDADIAAARG